ncbi:uncharacterized protein LOC114536444 [Dendronephthya gigantea]|uniref:uncharacterized protein LOC114536444 n=1 Tax=Dendronephthya gigantea TaxID=151771 RepID=UPI00106BB139|nr:uncharacterized protein LOC114536444 [Dendronephthya gigantea]
MIVYLVHHGADVRSKNADGETVLLVATKHGLLDLVKCFVEHATEWSFQEVCVALHSAIESRSLEIVKYFVDDCGADIYCKDESGKTPLHHAVAIGAMDIIKYLVEQCGADVNAKDANGKTVLDIAVTNKLLNIVKYLVEKGVDVNAKRPDRWPAVSAAIASGKLDIVRYLFERGADENGRHPNAWTALYTAIHAGKLDIVRYLVEKCADVNGKNPDMWTALYTAIDVGKLDIVRYLVEESADVNGKLTKRWEALSAAISSGKLDIVRYLFEREVDENGKHQDAWTALYTAIKIGGLDIVRYLVEQGADVNPDTWKSLSAAISFGKLDIVKYLFEREIDENGKHPDAWTALCTAIDVGKLDIVRYLVEKGADLMSNDLAGSTALFTAVVGGDMDIIRHLVETGADVNIKGTDGRTVLHAAVNAGALEIVNYLFEQGADITLKSEVDGHSLGIHILKMAVVKNSVILVNRLLDKNIDVWRAGTFLVEGRQMSLRQWSIHLGHDEIATILKRSIKHRKKIQMLKTINLSQLKAEIPMQAFIANTQFKIGDGGFSCVYVGILKDGSEVAVKRILVQTIGTYHRDDTFMYLIIDLCEETLRELVHECSIEHLQEHGPQMIREILSGLEFLHSKGILHRDLKPSNVLVDVEGRMKLADFGISRVLKDGKSTLKTYAKGTPGWMPPEVIEAIDRNEEGAFKRKSDVFVVGMIAFFILTKGEHPFGSSLDRMGNIMKGDVVNAKKLTDPNARKFVSWLINHRIDDRPYAHDALRDPFANRD